MTTPTLRAIGMNPFFEQQLADTDPEATVVVRVSAHHGSQVEVQGDDGVYRVPIQSAQAAGKVTVGDWLVLNASDHRAVRLLDRKTLVVRKAAGEEVKAQLIVANVDTVFIVSSCNDEFRATRLERYIAMVLHAGATPVVVLTKPDLCDDPDQYASQAAELHPGLDVVVLDARSSEQAEKLSEWCGPGQSVALLGSSGVGKSTLANALGVLGQATGRIREQDSKGRHTTTSRSLHLLPTGGVLVDNPGVRELQLSECDEGVADLFEDIVEIIKACKFSDCTHTSEPGCAVRAALESGELDERRYASFQKLNEEQAHNAKVLAKRKERELAKEIRAAVAKKRRNRGDF